MDEPAQEPQQYCLRWNNHQSTIVSIFDTLYRTEALVDCQIAVEGGIVYKAHRVVLSACSPYFADLLKTYNEQMYPTIVVCGIGANEIEAIMSYMYRGEVNISQERLPSLLRIAEFLKIKGLSESNASRGTAHHQQQPQQLPGNPNKRQRISSVPGIESEAAGQDEAISPRRRRRGIRRRSHDNNDNSNSSAVQDSLVHHNAPGSAQLGTISLTGNASTASAYSAMPHYAAASLGLSASALSAQAPLASSPLSVSVTKKTESGKSGTGAASDTTNVQTAKLANAAIDEHNQDSAITKNTVDKSSSSAANHQKLSKSATLASGSNTTSSNNNREPSTSAAAAQLGTEMVIEPKAEYVEDANEENVEDLTLDDEDMATGMDDMDQAAGTSQAGEGSSQGYANWQHERSNQDDLVLATQEGQQRDPQGKLDKGEQTDVQEYELDDCLLESNDIMVSQNKDASYVLQVKKIPAKSAGELLATPSVSVTTVGGQQITSNVPKELQEFITDIKPSLVPLSSSSQPIKLPSNECEIFIKKATVGTNVVSSVHHQHQQQQQQQHHVSHGVGTTAIIQTQHHQLVQQPHNLQPTSQVTQLQNIVTTHTHQGQAVNLMGLRNVQITEHKPLTSRIKYSRGKIIQPSDCNIQIVQTQVYPQSGITGAGGQHELPDGTKYEISELDISNPTATGFLQDMVKYSAIELADGTKISVGCAPTELSDQLQDGAQLAAIDHETDQYELQQHEHQHIQQIDPLQMQPQLMDDEEQYVEDMQEYQDDVTMDTLSQEHGLSKNYTILTGRSIKSSGSGGALHDTLTTTYELSLSDSSLGPHDDPESRYSCQHCGKRYRWKSTLRRHEAVECGNKEPTHRCPYCPYKSKQRGNLGVHVRKHHPEKPQLESKRGRKI